MMEMEGGKKGKRKANSWAMFVKKMGGVKNAVANKSQYKPSSKPKPKGKKKKVKGGSRVYG